VFEKAYLIWKCFENTGNRCGTCRSTLAVKNLCITKWPLYKQLRKIKKKVTGHLAFWYPDCSVEATFNNLHLSFSVKHFIQSNIRVLAFNFPFSGSELIAWPATFPKLTFGVNQYSNKCDFSQLEPNKNSSRESTWKEKLWRKPETKPNASFNWIKC